MRVVSCPDWLWKPPPWSVQGQVGWSLGQPGLVVGNHAHGRRLELGDLECPFQLKPFHDSIIFFTTLPHFQELNFAASFLDLPRLAISANGVELFVNMSLLSMKTAYLGMEFFVFSLKVSFSLRGYDTTVINTLEINDGCVKMTKIILHL